MEKKDLVCILSLICLLFFGIEIKAQADTLYQAGLDNVANWRTFAADRAGLLKNESGTIKTIHAAAKLAHLSNKRFKEPEYDVDMNAVKQGYKTHHKTGMAGLRNNLANVSLNNMSVSPTSEVPLKESTYKNPLLDDVADPDVLYVKDGANENGNGTYYVYATTPSRNVGGIKVYSSTDLVNWTDRGLAMTIKDNKNWGKNAFWAPGMIQRGDKFYMYYTAEEHLCVSVSDSPLGPFEQKVVEPMNKDTKEIDANVFQDGDQYYLYFVRFNNGNEIWGAKLNDDMLSIDKSTETQLLTPSQPWEKDGGNINEGPYMLKKGDTYFLTYSGSDFRSPSYGSGYATSKNPLGPFDKYKHNPIMQSDDEVHGAGHHAITYSPDQKEMFIVYHRHFNLSQVDPRQLAIDRIEFTNDEEGQTILKVNGPTVTEQPAPSGVQ